MNSIQITQARYSYPADREGSQPRAPALNGVTLSVARGEFVVLLGGSGSGKSTLLRLCAALLAPANGSVRIGGMDTRDEAHLLEMRRRFALVLDDSEQQIIGCTVAEDVAFGPENLGLLPGEISERVRDALILVGLHGEAETETSKLMPLWKLKLVLAGALAMQPECLLLDDPLKALDAAGRHEVLRLLHHLNVARGFTILLATADSPDADAAGRVILLENGRIAGDGSPQQVLPLFPPLMELPQQAGSGETAPPADGVPVAGSAAGTRVIDLAAAAGLYAPGASILHRADPRTKIALTLLFSAAALLSQSLLALALLLAVTAALTLIAGKPFKNSLRGLRLVLYMTLAATAANLVTMKGTPVAEYGLLAHVSREAVTLCAAMLLRLLAIAGTASLLTFTTTPFRLAAGVESMFQPLKRIGVPVSELAIMLLVALRFLPIIMEEAKRLSLAHPVPASRPRRAHRLQAITRWQPLLVPLFTNVIRRGDALATALSARCYQGGSGRTSMTPLAYSALDLACLIAAGVVLSGVAATEAFLG